MKATNISETRFIMESCGEVSGPDCHRARPGRNSVGCGIFTGLLESDKE